MKTSAFCLLAAVASGQTDEQVANFMNEATDATTRQDVLGTPFSCYKADDSEYIGLTSQTKSGKKCQNWQDTHPVQIGGPHQNDNTGDHSYCRQIGPHGNKPVCAPLSNEEADTSTDAHFEECDVPECPPDETVAIMHSIRDDMNTNLGEPTIGDQTTPLDSDGKCECASAYFGSSTSMSDTSVGLVQTKARYGHRLPDGRCSC